MSMARVSPSIPFLILSTCLVEAEGKCKCVDYRRDWYVIVTSFVSGLILSAIIAVSLKYYCRHCGGVKPRAPTTESQETLATQSQGDLEQFYEEVPGAGSETSEGDFETVGSFEQTFR
ncbi:Hypothetical predicted protein [Paramuricea clavata]|uniref:Uncharacterized protein n=1 Tax=Paramuricea clavata TaxID=317549 RepID=A0A6S7FLI0_PARCT|nr:Hypothetical predicted protein [Paramuricea clavata]